MPDLNKVGHLFVLKWYYILLYILKYSEGINGSLAQTRLPQAKWLVPLTGLEITFFVQEPAGD